ncbi:hypothetical protein ULMS_03260 [Patiriisocius marinistellae]|uniref:Uncharacterized protein n=1 Tax=Patiriisocius marinistellae TaxID=2494560 RepID=A0A5J4FUJ4_9FLAO|nr:S8 family serine peptidase [Patiriisocius marinistellae]GEQ84818.1 hypothetical protein ULMS_03260 [Patiriisocius marinistellae]
MKKATTFLMLLLSMALLAQSPYTIQFQDEVVVVEENINSFQWSEMPESSKFMDGYYGWIQFFETPTQEIQNDFKSRGFELIEYLPNKAYVFYFPENVSIQYLKDNGVRAIVPIDGEYKLSSALKMPPYPAYALNGDNIFVTLEFQKHADSNYVIDELTKQQIIVEQEYKGHNVFDLSIPNNCLETLSNLPFVKWVELIVAPDVKDDTRGRSLHRSSNLDTQTTAGRNYTGEGIGVMVRDDGIVGPHIDFQGRIDNSSASGTGQTHGDGVGGIMAGAGNLNPMMRGMAAGSNVFVTNYQANFLDNATTSRIDDGSVQITNSSYSNGCNDGYTTITSRVDEQTKDIPSLLHVFSAGNSNNQNCGYGAGNQWGNITGGHKQGKNVIATANVFFDGELVNSSSRGPAHDGRIKPDIAANGQNQNSTDENNQYMSFGGTSGAAPGIAGISAQLYEAYGDLNGGDLPQSALIKAALLNTANEAGNIGPDYKFGWGIVNGLRAAKIIEDNRYLSDNITQGTTNNHTIAVPAGTTQVRFMLYWSDVQASAGANPALVNDLDLVVNDPASNSLLPWILDPTPNATTLDNPATNGEDHLNNVEQVLINNPAAGNYTLDISGFNVPVGPQEYFVVYEVISDNITVTYPDGSESFVAGETESIHWDAINTTADFDLEYSTDGGTSWTAIATVGSNVTNYGWSVPTTITGAAQIRVTSGVFTDDSNANFSITNQVEGFAFSQVCPDEATFVWDALADAESYDVYLLGNKFMEVAGNATTTTITVPIADPNATIWAAIVAKNDTENWTSRRTIAISHGGGLLNCSLPNDIGVIEVGNDVGDFSTVCSGSSDVIVSAVIRNTGIDPQSNFDVTYQLSGQAIVTETFTATINSGDQVIFDFATPLSITTAGSYTLTITVNLTGDQNASNDVATLDFFAITEATPLDFEENFETNGVPPAGWSITNVDNDETWVEESGITGSDGNNTTAAFVDNYSYNAPGEEDVLTTEIFDLTSATTATLTFDLAKAQYSATLFDSMRVEVSIDCGGTFTTIYNKTNLDLSTLSGYETGNWQPENASDWRNESIDLTPYLGEVAQFKFININGYGNSTFIDNINLTSTLGINDNALAGITLYPNPASDKVFVDLTSETASDASILIVNSLGQTVQTISNVQMGGKTTATIDIAGFSTGMYFVTITSQGISETKKLLIK